MRNLNYFLKTMLIVLSLSAACQLSAQEAAQVEHHDSITQPEFKGGVQEMYNYILANFEYPEDAQKRSVSGTVEMEFTIEKSGDISFVGVLKGIEPAIDAELVRVFKNMPLWTPATRNGAPVRYKVSMPVTLKLKKSRNGTKSSYSI